jgi:choline monooxygenase
MVEPTPHLNEDDRRVWHYIFIYPNTTIDLYPDQVGIWRIAPDGPLRSADLALTLRPQRAGLRTRAVQYANRKVNELVSDEDADLVANQQAGLETRGFEPGPLSRREAALGWFADKIRADLGEDA